MDYRSKASVLSFLSCLAILLWSVSAQAQCLSGDCLDGIGIYKYPSGAVYKGHFKNGQFHGWGKCVYQDGDVYEGWWVERLPDGKGTMTKKDGTKITGVWRKGSLEEQYEEVQEVFAEKNVVQVGCLSGDCQNGYGIISFPNGDKYEGEFHQGKFHGECKWIYRNGDVFIGTFKNNYADGYGRVLRGDSVMTSGVWKEGAFLNDASEKAAVLPDCNLNDCGNVKAGRFVYENKIMYVGEFLEGKPFGWGRVSYGDDTYYEGEWINDQANGMGTYFDGSEEYYGLWREGILVEQKHKSFLEEDHPKPKPKPTPTPPKYESGTKVWTVIVGVSSYTHMKPLRYSDNDAFRLMAMLQSPVGGAIPDEQIRLLVDEDAKKENIIRSMKELFYQADEDDLVLLYFSGHGLVGSFLPIDYDGYNNVLKHEEIQEIFANSRAKYKLCIADACHAGSYDFSEKGSIESVVSKFYSNLSSAKGGTALILSSKSEETSLEALQVRQGVFSHFLLRGMKGEADFDGNKIITLGELFSFVNQGVKEFTGFKQSPILKGDYDTNMPISVLRE